VDIPVGNNLSESSQITYRYCCCCCCCCCCCYGHRL